MIIACLLPLAAPAQSQLPGVDAKWRLFSSAHFEVYSRNGETESRHLLRNLELVHAIFFESYGFKPVRAVPITVYFFSRDRHFEFYKPEAYRKLENLGTFYHSEPDRGVMTVAPLPSFEAAQQLAFGSYTHHLFRLMGGEPPVWYGYGMAGLFRNLDIKSESFELGRPDPHQVGRLRTADLIPVEVLFGADQRAAYFQSDRGNTLFQDQAWALVHYLYFGAHQLPAAGVHGFVDHALRQSGRYDAEATREAFGQATGLTYDGLERELRRYFRNGRYSYGKKPLPAVPPARSYAMRSVSVEEINLRLAELAVRINASPVGRLILLHAADRSGEAGRVQEVLAAAALRDGDWDQAAERWDQALAAGSDNPAVLHELLEHEKRKRFSRFDYYYRLPEDAAEKLRAWLARSIATLPDQSAAYEMLAWVEATAREPQVRNVNLVQARFAGLSDKPRTLLALAMVRARLGDKAGAEELLGSLEKMPQAVWVRYAAANLRAVLTGEPADYRRLPPLPVREATEGAAPVRLPPPPSL